jgi:RNA polymerase sigma factor (sigma-70 family)
MPKSALGEVVRYLHRVCAAQVACDLTDRELLERYLASHDETAFSFLVRRHGPMLFQMCRRVLGNAHEAEDVLQAAFLVLARRASSIRRGPSLGSWLYGVAQRIALRARARGTARRRREREAGNMRAARTVDGISCEELHLALTEAIGSLPEKYRAPIVLCYLEGQSHGRAARQLGCPKSSLESRLTRARELLRRQLERRGIGLAAGALATVLAEMSAAAPLPALVTIKIVKAAALIGAGKSVVGCLSAGALALAEEAMIGIKGKLLLLVIALSLGVSGVGWTTGGFAETAPPGATERKPAANDTPPGVGRQGQQVAADAYGDPLPPGVLARMGSTRLRQSSTIECLAFAPDGKTIASGGRNVYLWDVLTGKMRARINGESGWYRACDFSDQGLHVVSTGYGQTAQFQLVDPATRKILRGAELKEPAQVVAVAVSPGGQQIALARFGPNGFAVQVHDPATGQEKARFTFNDGFVRHVVFAPDGKTVAACSSSDKVRIHDASTGQAVRELKRDGDKIFRVAFSPDGRLLASLSRQPGKLSCEGSIWDLATGKELHRLTGIANGSCAAFSPDSCLLATGSEAGDEIILWDTAMGKETRRLFTQHSPGLAAFSPDGKTLAAAIGTGAITLWDVATGRLVQGPTSPIWDLTLHFADGGKRLLGTANVPVSWDPATRSDRQQTVRSISAISDAPIAWDIVSEREVRRFPDVPHCGWSCVLAPDESVIAATDLDGTIRLHDAATGEKVRVLKGHDKYVTAAVFSNDSRRLFSSSWDGTIRGWDVATGRELLKLACNDKDVLVKAVSPDAHWLISRTQPAGFGDASLVLWDLSSGREVKRLPRDFIFSPDSRWLAAVAEPEENQPGGLVVCDVLTGKSDGAVAGSKNAATCAAFSPDGRMLVSGDYNGGLRLWEVASRKERYRYIGHEGKLSSAAFSPKGNVLAAASADAPVYVWPVYGLDLNGKALGRQAPTALKGEELWSALAGEDASKAYQSICTLIAAPEVAVLLLRAKMRPALAVEHEVVNALIRDLESQSFPARKRAHDELAKLGELVEPALRDAISGKTSLEGRRRVEQLLEKMSEIPSAERLRDIRAAEVLEHLGTRDSRQLLESLAQGAPLARLTREAKASLERVGK